MITKTITSHDVYNYGASLQAYSLQQFLLENGHENEIIDYKPIYSRARYNFWYVSPRYRFSNCKLLWFPICLMLAPKRFRTYKRKIKFDLFTKSYLRLTADRFHDYVGLKNSNISADVFIVGSDQVWNSEHINGRDPANYLSFVSNSAKKISYAASFGMDHIYTGFESMVQKNLSDFSLITVREYHGLNILQKLGLNGQQVVDPTLLHSKQWWTKLCINKPSEDYLLVYDFGQSSIIKDVAKKIAKQLNLKIYAINDFVTHGYADVNINDAGPIEFVSLINNAKYFISNSFHGTIFSIIFEKPFLVVPRIQGNVNSRMESLLDLVAIKDRLIDSPDDINKVCPIDFKDVKSRLLEAIAYSKFVLLESLK